MTNWKEYRFGDIAEIVMGQSPKGETCNESGIGFPLLNGPTEFTAFYPLPTQYTTDPKRFSETNDLLFCVRGSTTGKMNWSDQKYAIGRGIGAIRHRNGAKLNHFVKGIIEYHLPTLLQSATGSTFPNVSREQLNGLKIKAPDLPTQTAIAEILSSLDDKIELNNKINQELENLAQTLFKQWFIDFEFPNENGEPYKSSGGEMVESELGEIPKGWELGTFGDVIKKESLKVKKSESIVYKVYSAVKTSELVLSDDYFTKKVYSKSINNYFIVKNNWFAYNPSRINIGSIGLNKTGIGAVSPVYIVFSTKKYFHFFIEYILQLENTKNAIIQRCSGTVRQSLNFEGLSSIPLKIPNSELVRMFNDFVENNSEHIKMISNETIELTNLRDTLLPKLISGELEVSKIQTAS
jgi:type I restriction enzyme S subunit